MHFRSGSHKYSVILSTRMHPIVLTAKLVSLYPYIAYQTAGQVFEKSECFIFLFIYVYKTEDIKTL